MGGLCNIEHIRRTQADRASNGERAAAADQAIRAAAAQERERMQRGKEKAKAVADKAAMPPPKTKPLDLPTSDSIHTSQDTTMLAGC